MRRFLQIVLEQSEGEDIESFIHKLGHRLVGAAQKIYDEWEQDGEGYSEEYGVGGICDDIASAMLEVFETLKGDAGLDDWEGFTHYKESDSHTDFYVANHKEKEILEVGLAPHWYEDGAGYTWKKIPDVELKPDMLTIDDLSWAYDQFFDEDGNRHEF